MYLKFKNFKQHDEFELELPNTGLILLQGPSGAGKTAIFEAIEDTLFGTQKDTKPWSGGKPECYMEFFGLQITRTTTPNTLKVICDGHEFVDAAAEAEIVRSLGMDYHEFMACSYIKQNFSNSLINLTPAEQMRFIQRLSSRKTNIEGLKSGIREKIKEKQNLVLSAKTERDQLSVLVEEMRKEPVPLPIKPEPVGDSSFREMSEQLEKLRQDNQLREKEIWEIETSIASRRKAAEQIDELRIEKAALLNDIKQLPELMTDKDRQNLDKLKQKLIDKTNFLNKKEKLIALAVSVYNLFPESKDWAGKLTEYLEQTILSISQSLDSTQKKLYELDEFANWTKQVLECPACKHPLKLENRNKLVKAEEFQQSEEMAENIAKIHELHEERDMLTSNLEFLRKVLSESQFLKKELGSDPAPEYESRMDIQKEVNKINEMMEQDQELRSKKLEADKKYESLVALEAKLQTDCKPVQDDELEVLELKKSALRTRKSILEKYQVKIEERRMYEALLANYESLFAKYNDYADRLSKMEKKLETANHNLSVQEKYLSAAVRLKECADFAASSAIEAKITEINNSTAAFVERMFADDGTIIQLSSFSKTQKGDDRAKISIEVFHKSHQLKNIKPFSGGEKSRVYLCFQLGLSELYASPIIMIDEGFTGLDNSLKAECLEVLKEVAENKLVLVIEHGAPESFFDEVIRI